MLINICMILVPIFHGVKFAKCEIWWFDIAHIKNQTLRAGGGGGLKFS